MFREIHILKTKNPSNIFKYFYEPAVMAEQDGLTGSAWGDWANYTASPLRAFENELGVQAPVGFWDPAGLSSDGSVENFKRRRATEIKHGRISMLATMDTSPRTYWKPSSRRCLEGPRLKQKIVAPDM